MKLKKINLNIFKGCNKGIGRRKYLFLQKLTLALI